MSKAKPSNNLRASDVRIGQMTTFNGERWQVAAPHPEPSTFWLHRNVDGRYETAAAHVKDLEKWRAQ